MVQRRIPSAGKQAFNPTATHYCHRALPSHARRLLLDLPIMHKILKSLIVTSNTYTWTLPLLNLCSLSHQRKQLRAHRSRNEKRKLTFREVLQDDLTSQPHEPASPTSKEKTRWEVSPSPIPTGLPVLGLIPAVHSKPTERCTQTVRVYYSSSRQLKCLWILCQNENVLTLNY